MPSNGNSTPDPTPTPTPDPTPTPTPSVGVGVVSPVDPGYLGFCPDLNPLASYTMSAIIAALAAAPSS